LEAVEKFAEANTYMGNHEWGKAEDSFRKTLLLDGSVAKYHAGLASLFMILQRYKEAEAEYTAAVLLDLDNANYRRLVKVARSKR
jgi:Tfp pilus assembly protein PilF